VAWAQSTIGCALASDQNASSSLHTSGRSKRGAIAEREEVDIPPSHVHLQRDDEMKKAMTGMLDPRQGSAARVAECATCSRREAGVIAGLHVLDGRITRSGESKARVMRAANDGARGEDFLARRFKDDVRRVKAGFGVRHPFDKFNDVKVGDVIDISRWSGSPCRRNDGTREFPARTRGRSSACGSQQHDSRAICGSRHRLRNTIQKVSVARICITRACSYTTLGDLPRKNT